MKEPNIHIHFVSEKTGRVVSRQFSAYVPSLNDEIRLGGEGKEKYYKVNRVVWVYDEPENPFYRVNVGVEDVV